MEGKVTDTASTDSGGAEGSRDQAWVIPEWQVWLCITVLAIAGVVGTAFGLLLHEYRLDNPRQTGQESPAAAPPESSEPTEHPSLEPLTAATGPGFTIQVGVFRNYSNAARLTETLQRQHGRVHLVESPTTGLYSVSLGPVLEERVALGIARQIEAEMDLLPIVQRSRPAGTSD